METECVRFFFVITFVFWDKQQSNLFQNNIKNVKIKMLFLGSKLKCRSFLNF